MAITLSRLLIEILSRLVQLLCISLKVKAAISPWVWVVNLSNRPSITSTTQASIPNYFSFPRSTPLPSSRSKYECSLQDRVKGLNSKKLSSC